MIKKALLLIASAAVMSACCCQEQGAPGLRPMPDCPTVPEPILIPVTNAK